MTDRNMRQSAIHLMQHLPHAIKEVAELQEEVRVLEERLNSKMGVISSLARAISHWVGVPNVWDEAHMPDTPHLCPVCGDDIGVHGEVDGAD